MFDYLWRNDQSLSIQVKKLVMKTVRKQGVPVSTGQVESMVDVLYPAVLRARENSWRAHMVDLRRQAVQYGVELKLEPVPDYPRHALYRAVADVCRLTPGSQNIRVEVLDEETKKKVIRPVMPSAANRIDDVVIDRIGSELGGRVSRHVLAAGREAVARVTHNGKARFKNSGLPAHTGYARVLSGRESCAFCAMLASRGPVYAEDTVMTRRDGRRYHDGCDCIPVLVVEGKPWVGQAEQKALYGEWKKHTWVDGKPGPDQWERWKKAVAAGKVDPRTYSPAVGNKNTVENVGKMVLGDRRDVVSLVSMEQSKARAYLHEHFTVSELTKEERLAVRLYTGAGHQVINRQAFELRDKLFEAAENGPRAQRRKLKPVVEAVRGLDSVIGRAPRVRTPLQVVRRVRVEELAGSATGEGFDPSVEETWRGQEFKAWGFLSTSTHGQDEFGDIELRLTLPKGTKGIYLGWDEKADRSTALSRYPQEEEYLLGRQVRYRIKRVRVRDGQRIVEAEVIGQDV